MEIYLDNSATTKSFDEVADLVSTVMTTDYGNPSSVHHKGICAAKYLDTAKKEIAATLKADPAEILFTSGGTESDNTALIGVAHANSRKGKHIITSKLEHPAILETAKLLESEGFEITYLKADSKGHIDLEDLKASIRPDTILVSIMLVNNEIGTREDVEAAGEIIKKANPNTYFHVDAVQGYGKYRINPSKSLIDLLSVSGHKIHGPKGVGFLYIKKGTKINPLILGGGQQKGMRSGTDNVPGIAGLGLAASKLYANFDEDISRMRQLKDYFIKEVTSKLDGVYVNGDTSPEGSAPHIISLSIESIRAEVLLNALGDKEIYISAGSACASNRPHTSQTLEMIGLDSRFWDSTLRFSLSVFTSREEIDYTIKALCDIVPMLRKYTRH